MRIKRYQDGGIVYLPTSNQIGAAGQQAASSESEGSSKVPGFSKEIIDLVKQNGLDSDVVTFLNQVERTLKLAHDPTGEHLSLREILKVQRLASQVATNYKDYEKARASLNEQDAWGEMATDKRGYLYVKNNESGQLETISHSEYKENQDKYIALTNEDLLNVRRADTSLAYRMDILDNISSAVGMKTITDYAKGLIKEFGKTNITGYSEKQANQIRSGLEHIISGDIGNYHGILESGPDGVYKISQESTIADTGINAALNYLLSTLPRNYQNTLSAKATVEGYSPEAMLLQMMYINTDRAISADYDQTASKVAGFGNANAGDSSPKVQHTLAETYADGVGAPPPQLLQITPDGSRTTLLFNGQNVGKILKDRSGNPGNPIPMSNLAQIREDAYGIGSITSNTVVFGDRLIDPDQIGGIVYNNSDMYRVVLPSKVINGGRDIVPDFKLQKKLEDIIENGKNQGADPSIIDRYIQQECPGAKYDPEKGTVILPRDRCHVFLTFGAIAADNYVDLDSEKNFIGESGGKHEKSEYLVKIDIDPEAYMSAAKFGYANHEKNDMPRSEGSASINGWFRTGRTARRMYTGNVFMPVTSIISGSTIYNQEYIPRDAYTNITGRAIEHDRRLQIRDEFNSGQRQTNWLNE